MAVNLSEGVIAMMCSSDSPSTDTMPVLQVADIRLVTQQQQQNSNERYRMVLSDGCHLQQGMLATQKNDLVRCGRLQKGSIVRLTQFVCNVVQNRKIIIIIDLDVILDKCDPIGEPKYYGSGSNANRAPQTGSASATGSNADAGPVGRPTSAQFFVDQTAKSVNPQSAGVPLVNRTNVGGGTPLLQPKIDHGTDSSFYSGSGSSGRYAAGQSPRVGVPGSHRDQNEGFGNTRTAVSRASMNAYARPPQPAYQQPPPMYINRGPVARNEASARVIPIAALNPYQGRWTIKARVTAKGDLRHYNNPRGDGKVFSFDLLDSDGGEIRATCFNLVADQFYNVIEAGKVYLISKGTLKPARKTFNHLQNDYEISLETTSTVQPCYEDDGIIPRQQFHFRLISEIESMESNSILDVIGVVSFISPLSSIMRKNGTETLKRTLHLRDMSDRSVELVLWGNFCNAEGQTLQNTCDSGIFPVLAVKTARVSEFNGKAIGTISSSQLFIEPDFPEARRLREWFDKEGHNVPTVSISRESNMGRKDVRKTITQIKDERLGTLEKPDWITVSATVSFLKVDNFCYTACPIMIGDRQCNKKVVNNGDGKWRCERCDQSVDDCDYRYILQFQIQDHTGLTWVTAFQEAGEEIMGISAKDLYYMKFEEQDNERFGEIIREVLFSKYIFKLKVKEETFSDEQRVKSSVIKAEKVNFSKESTYLLEFMNKMMKGEDLSSTANTENTTSTSGVGNGFDDVGNRQSAPPAMNYVGNTNAGGDMRMPENQVNQHGNQRGSSTGPQASAPNAYLYCISCGSTGHRSETCPTTMSCPGDSGCGGFINSSPSSVGSGAGGASGDCFKCHQYGHWARDCPGVANDPQASGRPPSSADGAFGDCFKCHQPGHWARDCPGLVTVPGVPPGYGSSTVASKRYGVGS